ncbi:hypothetical protein C8R44DRAFT_732166 [Mycena epipterygia]|nr:hypothetical protein C8R44DRAFT_732166 [Mycena epipterygia]
MLIVQALLAIGQAAGISELGLHPPGAGKKSMRNTDVGICVAENDLRRCATQKFEGADHVITIPVKPASLLQGTVGAVRAPFKTYMGSPFKRNMAAVGQCVRAQVLEEPYSNHWERLPGGAVR